MTTAAYLTMGEVIERSGWTPPTAYRRLEKARRHEKVNYKLGPRKRNGVRDFIYLLDDLSSLWPEIAWEPTNVVSMPADILSFEDQLGALGDKARVQATFRYRVIGRLLQAGVGDGYRGGDSTGRTALLKQVAAEHGLAWRTVYGWVERFRGDARGKYAGLSGIVALADRARADKGVGRVNLAGQEYIRRLVLDGRNGSLPAKFRRYESHRLFCERNAGLHVWNPEKQDELRAYLDENMVLSREAIPTAICFDTFRRYAAEVPSGQVDLARGELDKHKNTQVPFNYRAYRMKPLEFVVMDHRQADVMCAVWDRGAGRGVRLIRPWMTCAMDMRTRRWLAWVLVEQPDSHSITTVVRMLLEQFGRPKNFYWDNGGDFECTWVEGLMTGLGCKVIHALPGLARSKPIEPNFRRVSIWERDLETWTGHRTDVRPERLARKEAEFKQWKQSGKGDCPFPTLDELRKTYQVIFAEINARKLRGAGMEVLKPKGRDWLSPLQCWERLAGEVVFEKVPLSALNSLLREQRQRKVRHGQIRMRYGGFEAIYVPTPEYPPLALADLNGKTVDVAIDPLDLEKVVVYYRGEMVCVCQNLALRGMGEAAFKEGIKIQRQITKAQREAMRAIQPPIDAVSAAALALDAEGPFAEPARPSTTLAYPKHERMAAALAGSGGGRAGEQTPSWQVRRPEQGDDFSLFGGEEE